MVLTQKRLICKHCTGVNPKSATQCFHCKRTIKIGTGNSFIKDILISEPSSNKPLYWNSDTQTVGYEPTLKEPLTTPIEAAIEKKEELTFEKCNICRLDCTHETGCRRLGKRVRKVSLSVEGKKERYDLSIQESGNITVGRSITLWDEMLDLTISRIHCVISFSNDQYLVEETVSTKHGTFINSNRLMPMQKFEIKSGDVLKLGDKRFVFYVD
jgi:hypothetical protein